MTKANLAQSARFVNAVAYNGLMFFCTEKGQTGLWATPSAIQFVPDYLIPALRIAALVAHRLG